MRLAAVDIGTNTVRLLVVDHDGEVRTELHRVASVVGLGVGVDSTGRLGDEAIDRALAALAGFADSVSQADACRVIATAASRDAANRESFFDSVETVLGHRPELITGEEEAGLAFAGATSGRTGGPFLVIDIGGGSTEFVTGQSTVSGAVSTQIGSVRLTERASLVPPVSSADVDRARETVRGVFATVPKPKFSVAIGVAGTYTSLSALSRGLVEYDRSAVHGSVLTPDQPGRRSASPGSAHRGSDQVVADDGATAGTVHLGRALIADEVSRWCGIDRLIVSEHDLLDGVVSSLLPQ